MRFLLVNRTEIDRWIISELNTLIRQVEGNYEDYEPTKSCSFNSGFCNG